MSSSTEASRPYVFGGDNFYSGRALAQGLFRNWEIAKESVRNTQISRWLEQSLNRKEQATQLVRSIQNTGGEKSSANKHNAELVARNIVVMDSYGPMRVEHAAFHINSVGYMIAHALLTNNTEEMASILSAIQYDLPTLQADLNEDIYSENADLLWLLDKARQNLQKADFGFGVERALYDLNPNLPCMSPLMKGYFVTNNRELLLTLNHLAVGKTEDDGLVDRHLAAFCASRASIFKDVKFKALHNFPNIAKNPELHVIYILAMGQKTEKLKGLQGLAHWCALRIHKMVPEIHGIKMREAMGTELRRAAEQGNLQKLMHYLINTPAFETDKAGFEKAAQHFAYTRMKIYKLRSVEQLKAIANAKGTAIAAALSFSILVISVYNAIKDNFL